MSVTLDSKIEFKELCSLFDEIVKVKGIKKLKILQTFTRKWRVLASQLKVQNSNMNISLFPIFRLILPNWERERGPYGLKTKSLTNLYIKVFCLGNNSAITKSLRSYRQPLNNDSKNDDFAGRMYWLLSKRLRNDNSGLTIQNVNEFLDDVARCQESNQSKYELFTHFMRKASAVELKWLTRILLKELKLGLSHKSVFEAIHPKAEEQFNVTSNLRLVCDKFAEDLNSDETETAIEIELFSHVKPMLLERFKIEHIGNLFIDNPQCYVQTKFDGERQQLHMKDGKFKYFTRRGFDCTNNPSYGETVDLGGFLTTKIAKLLNNSCHSIILDGEMMGWHKQKYSFGSKGLEYDVKKLTEKSRYQPCFVAYDILLYNDEILVNKSYSERLNYLKFSFTEKEGVLMLAKTNTVTKVEQLMQIFNVSVDNDDEGIVVKKCDALYRPNVREKSGCYKIKAEYSDGLIQDLDLIILGGYYGQGRFSGLINSFLVGISDPPSNKNGIPSRFLALVSVSSGLSNDELKSIQQKLKPHWKDSKPIGVFGPKSQPPDVWISPKQSLVLQLRATEIIRSNSYPSGYSLRFPRVLKVRYDKGWHDACSTTEFLSLIKDNGGVQKLTKRKMTVDDIDEIDEEKIPKIRKTAKSVATVYNTFVTNKNIEVMRISRLFEDKEFCIVNGDDELDKDQIAKIIQEHMGIVVQNPGKDTYCVLVGNPEVLRAQNLISSKKYDVASLAWLKRATRPENFSRIQDFYPWELYSANLSTQYKLNEIYDEYFDNYFEDADEETLKRIIKIKEEKLNKDEKLSISAMNDFDKFLFDNQTSCFSIFRGIVGYFINQDDIEKYSFSFMSGEVSEELSSNVDYVFVDNEISTEALELYKYEISNMNYERSIKILKNKWIADSFKKQKLIFIEDYVV